MERRRAEHFIALDGLRGVAALAVMLSHTGSIFGIHHLFSHAYLAVDLFFALSGFVISHAYEGRLNAGGGYAFFARARAERLLPLIVLGAAIGAAVGLAVMPTPWLPWYLIAAACVVPVFTAPGGMLYPLNPPEWSLFFELTANAVHALVLRRLGTQAIAALTLLSAPFIFFVSARWGALSGGSDAGSFLGGFARVAFPYLSGVLLYRLYRVGRLERIRGSFLACAVAVAFMLALPGQSVSWVRDPVFVVAAFPLALLFAVKAAPNGRSAQLATALGALSYPLYILHYPILLLGRHLADAAELTQTGVIATGLAGAAVATLLAWTAQAVYDKPLRAALTRRALR